MPCTDGGVPYGPTREEVLERKAPAMLCAFLRCVYPENLESVLQGVDWHEAGVTRAEFDEWWRLHRQRDEERRAYEKRVRRSLEAKREALAKLSPEERKALGFSE